MLKERNVYAFMTILNLEKLENKKLSEKITNLFINSCEERKLPIISKLIAKHKNRLGFFLNGRVINFPFCMVADTYEQLLEDKKFIDETEDLTEEDKLEWDFTYLLYFIPVTTKVRLFFIRLINRINMLFQLKRKLIFRNVVFIDLRIDYGHQKLYLLD